VRRLAILLLGLLLGLVAGCSEEEESQAERESTTTAAPAAGKGDAQREVEVDITAGGLEPASAKVTTVGRIIFENNDSEAHTIVAPAGDEFVVESGETFNFKNEGCCAATFTDKDTGTEFEITVPRAATGLYD
jgi:plastocyanin